MCMEPTMGLSFLALIMLALLGLLAVGGTAALLRHERTRPLGYILLFIPVALLALAAFRMFGTAALGGATRASGAMLRMPVMMLLVVGGIAALVALLANRRTRPVGYVLLAVPVALGGLAVVVTLYSYSETPYKEIRQNGHITHGNTIPLTQLQNSPIEMPAVAPTPSSAKSTKPKKPAKPKAAESPKATKGPNATKGIVRSIATAFGQTLAELKGPTAKKAAPKKTDGEDENTDAENSDADRISQMVDVLSGAVQQELPDDVEVDQFTALRALGKLLGRIIASEQQEDAMLANGSDTQKTSAAVAVKSNEKRPAWLDAPPQSVGDAYQVVFVVGPYTTRLECDQAMSEPLNRAVAEYAVLYLGDDKARQATLPMSFLRNHVIKDQWEEIFQSSVGKMVRVHTRLLFDGRTNTELKASLRRATIEERLWIAGTGLAAILMVLAGCFGVMKFDHATGGSYRGRMVFVLFFVGVVALGTLLWVAWQGVS